MKTARSIEDGLDWTPMMKRQLIEDGRKSV